MPGSTTEKAEMLKQSLGAVLTASEPITQHARSLTPEIAKKVLSELEKSVKVIYGLNAELATTLKTGLIGEDTNRNSPGFKK